MQLTRAEYINTINEAGPRKLRKKKKKKKGGKKKCIAIHVSKYINILP